MRRCGANQEAGCSHGQLEEPKPTHQKPALPIRFSENGINQGRIRGSSVELLGILARETVLKSETFPGSETTEPLTLMWSRAHALQ